MYTDGVTSERQGLWKAVCGVWFNEDSDSPHNMSIRTRLSRPQEKQTVNGVELTSVVCQLKLLLVKEFVTPITSLNYTF